MNEVSSGHKSRMDELNAGLGTLQLELSADDTALVRVMLGIVSVGGPNNDADIMMDWTDASEFVAFPLKASGTTPLGKGLLLALQMIDEEKKALRAAGISYTRPWIMVISDGEPTDTAAEWESAVKACIRAENNKETEIFSIGVAGANLTKLGQISSKPPLMLSGTKFKDLFIWLSASLSAASRSRPGDVLQLPSTDPWRNVGI
jgi:hypothetical protein